jgi:hypothetical protein
LNSLFFIDIDITSSRVGQAEVRLRPRRVNSRLAQLISQINRVLAAFARLDCHCLRDRRRVWSRARLKWGLWAAARAQPWVSDCSRCSGCWVLSKKWVNY